MMAGEYPLAASYHRDAMAADLPPLVARVNELVAEETGLSIPGTPAVAVVTRREWVERTLGSFSAMLEPAERRIAERLDRVGGSEFGPLLARRLVAAETGALLGFLARRVLGQYELVLPTGDDTDSIAFVAGNILAMERAHQFLPQEFRTWIALHEAAHRAQFVGVPWMRGHFRGLVDSLIEGAEPDPGRLGKVIEELLRARRRGRPLLDERGLLGLFSTPAQHQTLDRVQALMSLLEGHGHVVMDRLGARLLRTQPRMAAILKTRRHDPRTAALFRLTGLEMKLKQYELGERFVLEVERRAGWEALSAAWQGPDTLPRLDEIEEPLRWLDRVA